MGFWHGEHGSRVSFDKEREEMANGKMFIVQALRDVLALQPPPIPSDVEALHDSLEHMVTTVIEEPALIGFPLIDNVTPDIADKLLERFGVGQQTKEISARLSRQPLPPLPGSSYSGFTDLIGGMSLAFAPAVGPTSTVFARLYQPYPGAEHERPESVITGMPLREGTISINMRFVRPDQLPRRRGPNPFVRF